MNGELLSLMATIGPHQGAALWTALVAWFLSELDADETLSAETDRQGERGWPPPDGVYWGL